MRHMQQALLLSERPRRKKSYFAVHVSCLPGLIKRPSLTQIHLRSHTKERPFKCRVCERGFTTKGNLKQHLLTHNVEVDEHMLEPIAASQPPSTSPNHNSSTLLLYTRLLIRNCCFFHALRYLAPPPPIDILIPPPLWRRRWRA